LTAACAALGNKGHKGSKGNLWLSDLLVHHRSQRDV
jgi:hypothetical protein